MRKTVMAVIGAIAFALTPVPAFADDGLSLPQTVGIFVGIPVAIWGVIWFLWMIPEWRRHASARATGDGWHPTPAE